MLQRAHGWDGTDLHRMLKSLPHLNALHLFFPNCCGLVNFALSSHHPNLRAFSLESTILPNSLTAHEPLTKDFFRRHQTLQYLHLTYESGEWEGGDYKDPDGMFTFDEGDLPNLRALSWSRTQTRVAPHLRTRTSGAFRSGNPPLTLAPVERPCHGH